MNADDEKKLQRIANLLLGRLDIANEPDEQEFDRGIVLDELREAFALGRARGMTEAAGICRAQRIGIDAFGGIDCHIDMTRDQCAAAIEKARDA